MKIDGRPYRSIWTTPDERSICVIDQTKLPHALETAKLSNVEQVSNAIRGMVVRGAPLIGVTGAYGLALALRERSTDEAIDSTYELLLATRPTAVNLRWALDRVRKAARSRTGAERVAAAWREASAICEEDVETCKRIGEHGLDLLCAAGKAKKDRPLNVLTHCNAGWLAAVDWGTALSPVYAAHDRGISLHVWVGETRPRNQGASLTAYELGAHGVPHTIIADSAGGHLMQRGEVDLCIVGADRVTAHGDVANKIGTYLKALAAKDNLLPFYVAMPSSTIDWTLESGAAVPIEERAAAEVTTMTGLLPDGRIETIRLAPTGSSARNPAFDVTPAQLVTSFITEQGICRATAEGLSNLFGDRYGSGRQLSETT